MYYVNGMLKVLFQVILHQNAILYVNSIAWGTRQSATTLWLLMMMEPVFMTNIKMTPRAPLWRRFDSEVSKATREGWLLKSPLGI